MMKDYECNPRNLPDNAKCYGVCVTAFRPNNAGTSVDRKDYKEIISGTYKGHRFRPDMLIEGTVEQNLIYFQINWVMFPEKSDAEAFRAVLAKEYAKARPERAAEMMSYVKKA